MKNDQQTIHPRIERYLRELENKLVNVPKPEREQQVLEIQGHLQAVVYDKTAEGKSEETAAVEALGEFISTDELAEQINSEFKSAKDEQFGENYGFAIGVGFLFAGLGMMAVSILKGTLMIESLVIGLVAAIATLIWLFSDRLKWTGDRVEHIRKASQPLIVFIIPLGAVSFIIRSISDGQANFFSFFLFAVYSLFVMALYTLMRKLYKRKKVLL